jgi:hypothetical protein
MQSLSKTRCAFVSFLTLFYRLLFFSNWDTFFIFRDKLSTDGVTVLFMGSVYVIVGYFGLHGNPMPAPLTWLVLSLCYYVGCTSLWGNPPSFFRFVRPWIASALLTVRSKISGFVFITSTMRVLSYAAIPLSGNFARCVSWLGSLTFAVLLIHTHPCIDVHIFSEWLRGRDVIGLPCDKKFWISLKRVTGVAIASMAMDTFRILILQVVVLVMDILGVIWSKGVKRLPWWQNC